MDTPIVPHKSFEEHLVEASGYPYRNWKITKEIAEIQTSAYSCTLSREDAKDVVLFTRRDKIKIRSRTFAFHFALGFPASPFTFG